MEERILEFIGDLRRAEVRISPSEALDALSATSEIGLEDRETFKAALASTLVKEARDEATFEPRWIEAALELAGVMIEQFWDPAEGGFFYTGRDHEQLIA